MYGDAAELADSVASYLAAGLERDEPGVLVATPEHLSLFADRLGSYGWALSGREGRYILVSREAQQGHVPLAQLILMWVSSNMPRHSSQILASARTHYARVAV